MALISSGEFSFPLVEIIDLIKFSNVKINNHYGADDVIKYITTSDVDLNQGEIINWEEIERRYAQ